jgi:hypothetical protein
MHIAAEPQLMRETGEQELVPATSKSLLLMFPKMHRGVSQGFINTQWEAV